MGVPITSEKFFQNVHSEYRQTSLQNVTSVFFREQNKSEFNFVVKQNWKILYFRFTSPSCKFSHRGFFHLREVVTGRFLTPMRVCLILFQKIFNKKAHKLHAVDTSHPPSISFASIIRFTTDTL